MEKKKKNKIEFLQVSCKQDFKVGYGSVTQNYYRVFGSYLIRSNYLKATKRKFKTIFAAQQA